MAISKIVTNSIDQSSLALGTTGNVGIGTSSPVSDAKLTISSDNTESYVFLQRSGSGRFDAAIGNNSGNIVFRNGADSATVAGLTERMRIEGDTGNVLIGATSSSGLDSGADNLVVGGGSGSTGMTIYSGTTGVGGINFADGTSGSAIYAGGMNYNHSTNNLSFYTEDGSTRMRLNANDSVLNGAAVPDANGNPTTNTISIGGSGWYATMTGANNYWNHSYNGTVYNLRYRGSGVGSIVINSGSVAFNTTSDYRLKENIQPMTGALAKVAQLKPCTYTWKATGESNEGFIAHELAEVCPQAVTGEKDALDENGDIKPQGIDTSFLVATLTAAIQELKAEFDEYKRTHP